MSVSKLPIVLTFGTFDLFHSGHLNILRRAADLGRVVVGISTDALTLEKKGRLPVQAEMDRSDIVRSIRYVSGVFAEESLEKKREYLLQYEADYLVMGDDWKGRFDDLSDICEVIYFPRTPEISTTSTIQAIRAVGTSAS